MSDRRLSSFPPDERAVYSVISQNDGLKARDISSLLGLSRTAVNHILFSSPLMRELCFQDNAWRWHALIRQASVHEGLYQFVIFSVCRRMSGFIVFRKAVKESAEISTIPAASFTPFSIVAVSCVHVLQIYHL